MPCLLAILALAMPRIVIVLLWLLTHWFRGTFATPFWPLLGFVFLPTTLLWYTAVLHWFGGRWDVITIAGIVVALIIDVSPASSRRRARSG